MIRPPIWSASLTVSHEEDCPGGPLTGAIRNAGLSLHYGTGKDSGCRHSLIATEPMSTVTVMVTAIMDSPFLYTEFLISLAYECSPLIDPSRCRSHLPALIQPRELSHRVPIRCVSTLFWVRVALSPGGPLIEHVRLRDVSSACIAIVASLHSNGRHSTDRIPWKVPGTDFMDFCLTTPGHRGNRCYSKTPR